MPAGAVTKAVARGDAELRRQVVPRPSLLGSAIDVRWDLAGTAIGVAIAILYKYVAMVALALWIGGITWREFLRVRGAGPRGEPVRGAVCTGDQARVCGERARDPRDARRDRIGLPYGASPSECLTGQRLWARRTFVRSDGRPRPR
jgi:hypothetical protein